MDVEFNIEGLDEIKAKMAALEKDLRTKAGRAAWRKSANLVRDAAKANAAQVDNPETPENIEKNIVVKWDNKHFRRTKDLKFRVGVLGGAKYVAKAVGEVKGKGKENPGGDTFYWRFLEFGTKKMQAQPFLRKALTANVQQAIDTFAVEYSKSIDRAIKRAQKAGK